jgi:hypothetical protein
MFLDAGLDLARVWNARAIDRCVTVPSYDSLAAVVRRNENNKHTSNALRVSCQRRVDIEKVYVFSHDPKGAVQCPSLKITKEIESLVAQAVHIMFAAPLWPLVALSWARV